MFCKYCGIQLNDGVKFCSNCGTAIESTQPIASTQQPVSRSVEAQNSNEDKSKKIVMSKGFIGGIVMFVLGVIAIIGNVTNGNFEKMSTYGADLADIIAILLEVGLILGGAYLVYKSTKKE